MGLGLSFQTKYLSKYYFEMSTVIMKNLYIVDYRLKNLIKQRLEYFLELRLRKGIRLFKGLAIRGQRTHSNCKTLKRTKPLISKKFEFILKKPVVVNEKGKHKNKGKEKGNVKIQKKKHK